jgi:hypothetical protein
MPRRKVEVVELGDGLVVSLSPGASIGASTIALLRGEAREAAIEHQSIESEIEGLKARLGTEKKRITPLGEMGVLDYSFPLKGDTVTAKLVGTRTYVVRSKRGLVSWLGQYLPRGISSVTIENPAKVHSYLRGRRDFRGVKIAMSLP